MTPPQPPYTITVRVLGKLVSYLQFERHLPTAVIPRVGERINYFGTLWAVVSVEYAINQAGSTDEILICVEPTSPEPSTDPRPKP